MPEPGVVSFDAPDWTAPEVLLLDTSVVVAAVMPSQSAHWECNLLLDRAADAGTKVVFNRLLEIEMLEAVFRQALRDRWGSRAWKPRRFDGRARRRAGRLLGEARGSWHEFLATVPWTRVELSEVADQVPDLMCNYGLASYDAVHAATALVYGVEDLATVDSDFALVPGSRLTLHTTTARTGAFRALRV